MIATAQVGIPSRTFGGFFYDRALGRPVTLDIGFGPFKSRVIGPSDEALEQQKKEEELVDLSSPVTLLVVLTSGTVNFVGQAAGVSNVSLAWFRSGFVALVAYPTQKSNVGQFLREFLEAIDLFVGRYLVLLATFYIGIKFLHFKVFPDFP